ncbi:MAG: DUF1501 domain-containing protein [Burkholderiales bacterium]|nr:DUF1501 domain-containing protein [Anaerolineae bacterium]
MATLSRISRRHFCKTCASSLSALATAQAALPMWLPRFTFAPDQQNARGDVLVVVFLRGGADSLNMIVPHGEESYYRARPELAIPRPDASGSDPKALDMDGFFGLHPSFATLHPIFLGGQMTAIHATGSPDPTRSHFEAMDFMERGTPGDYGLNTGWIGRHLATLNTGNTSPLRAVGWSTAVQQALRGPISPVAMRSIVDYHLNGDQAEASRMLSALNELYRLDTLPEGEELQAAADATTSAIEMIGQVDIAGYRPQNGATYPEGDFAAALMQTAALIRADVGLETAAIDLGGWDTHINQGGATGNQANLMRALSDGLAAFHADMGTQMSGVTVVVMSEFGRRVAENGSAGTDHGHGGAMMVMSGSLTTGPVVANWPGLSPDALDSNEDLAITIDYRDVLSEVLTRRLNNPYITDIFPNFTPTPNSVGLFGA